MFDTSHMGEAEYDRLLLWSGRYLRLFGKTEDDELTAEVYRRAAQVRKEPKHKETPYEVPVVRMAEIYTEDM